MKASLQLGMGQQLTITHKLQQAIRLLQLSSIDLAQEIQLQIDSNPLLDSTDNQNTVSLDAVKQPEQEDHDDVQWSQLYSNQHANYNDTIDKWHEAFCSTHMNLQDYLHWQLDLTPLSALDKIIAKTLIDAIDENGFLTLPLTDIQTTLSTPSRAINVDDIAVVQHRIQRFDPVGCASHSLQESLLIQLDQLPASTPFLALAKDLLLKHSDLLSKSSYRDLLTCYQIDEYTLNQAMKLIRTRHPKPGLQHEYAKPDYMIPDLFAKKINNRWHVKLNETNIPRLRIHSMYASMIKHVTNKTDSDFLKTHLQEAQWFLKSIQHRHNTLQQVATYLLEYQYDFFEHGHQAMKPLTLSEVADALSLNESTISRITTQKFMHTPQGLLELKDFFSSGISNQAGACYSSTAIRALIKKMIRDESPQHPLSDTKLVALMATQGIRIARRTVAKYREAMNIRASNERKKP